MKNRDIQKLAERNGLVLSDEMSFNEMGIDFKVGFATDRDGTKWLLRIPRRTTLGEQIANEKRILQLVSKYLSVQVPDWRIANENNGLQLQEVGDFHHKISYEERMFD
jgi:macrolide phosphotransferase